MLESRQRAAEWMDEPDADPRDLEQSLRFIRGVNRVLGYTRASIAHLERFSRRWKPGERISIIDLATGSADIPRAMLKWADRRGFDLRIVGVDLHHATAQLAAAEARKVAPASGPCALASESTGETPVPPLAPHPPLQIVRADVLNLPFADASFDYAHTAMFLHHLSDDDAAKVLAIMNCVARRGIIAADLLRNARAYRWIRLFTTFARPMIKHDARVSVEQAFSEAEALALRQRAGVGYAKLHRHFAHRFVLAGEKPSPPHAAPA